MIAHLKPYAEYKESGLPWLGDIPLHWEPTPNRAHLRIRKLPVGQRHPEYQLLSLTKRGVIVRDLSENRGKFSSDMGTSQEVRVGDLVFCLFDVPETPRTVGLSRHAGMITGAYTVMECADPKIARFFEAFYIAMDDRKLLSPLYSGLRNTIPKVRFLGAKTPLPPPDEQAAIVRFLDWANGRLERAIRAKRKVIALLNEQKQAIIHRAVTRGLDPSVPLKPSGIPWLGDIPQHWEVRRLGSLLRERGEGNDEGEISYVLSLLRGRGVIPYDEKGRIGNKKSDDITRYKIVRPDDIVMNCMNVIIGSVGISRYTGCLSPVYYVLVRRNVADSPHYLNAVFQCSSFHRSLVRIGNGILAHRMRIPMELLKCELLPYPPCAEQAQIVEELRSATGAFDRAIDRTEREMELLREYRTRLVADVVTGKLDVRETAVQLPAGAGEDEQEPLDEDEATLEELSEGDVVEGIAVDEENAT
jgi:type I restriction enzyme S subunit